jgi:hypothetical protein
VYNRFVLFQVLVQATERMQTKDQCEGRTVSQMHLDKVTLQDKTSALKVNLYFCWYVWFNLYISRSRWEF